MDVENAMIKSGVTDKIEAGKLVIFEAGLKLKCHLTGDLSLCYDGITVELRLNKKTR